MKFELRRPGGNVNSQETGKQKESGGLKPGLMKAGALAKLLLAFEVAVGNPMGAQESGEGNDPEKLKDKTEENINLLGKLVPKIDQEGQEIKITNGTARSLNREFTTHNSNAIHTESGATIIHRHNKATNEQTGEIQETGIITFIDVDSDGSPDRVISNDDPRATEANAQLLGLQKDFSDFDMVSMMSRNKKEKLSVMSFSKEGEATIYDYTTGQQITLDKEKSADWINSATNGYNANLDEMAE